VRVEVEGAGEEKLDPRKERRRILGEIISRDGFVAVTCGAGLATGSSRCTAFGRCKPKGEIVRFYTQLFLDPVPGAPMDRLGMITGRGKTIGALPMAEQIPEVNASSCWAWTRVPGLKFAPQSRRWQEAVRADRVPGPPPREWLPLRWFTWLLSRQEI